MKLFQISAQACGHLEPFGVGAARNKKVTIISSGELTSHHALMVSLLRKSKDNGVIIKALTTKDLKSATPTF